MNSVRRNSPTSVHTSIVSRENGASELTCNQMETKRYDTYFDSTKPCEVIISLQPSKTLVTKIFECQSFGVLDISKRALIVPKKSRAPLQKQPAMRTQVGGFDVSFNSL